MAPPRLGKKASPAGVRDPAARLPGHSRSSSVSSARSVNSGSGRSDCMDVSTPLTAHIPSQPDAKRSRATAITPSPIETTSSPAIVVGSEDGAVTNSALAALITTRFDAVMAGQAVANNELKRLADVQSSLKNSIIEVKTDVEVTKTAVSVNSTRLSGVEEEIQWLNEGQGERSGPT